MLINSAHVCQVDVCACGGVGGLGGGWGGVGPHVNAEIPGEHLHMRSSEWINCLQFQTVETSRVKD